jgi:hypothetical protein
MSDRPFGREDVKGKQSMELRVLKTEADDRVSFSLLYPVWFSSVPVASSRRFRHRLRKTRTTTMTTRMQKTEEAEEEVVVVD